MATIVTRAGKGSPLTNTEVDANFTNLNTDKQEILAEGAFVDGDKTKLDDNIIYNATNTNNVAGVWKATISDVTSYTDGLMIAFYPNKIDGVSGGTTFEVNSLGAKTVTRPDSNETAITTHYDGTNLIFLRYVSADDYFIVHANYNTTDDYRIRYEHNVTANNSAGSGTAWYGYELLMEGIDGKFYPVTEGGSTGNTNAVSTVELRVGGAMLVYLSSTNRTANTNTGSYSLYEAVRHTSMEYWNNRDAGWATSYRPWYIVATINANGNFVLDNTSYTSFLTQDLPTSDDGKYYIHGGLMLNNYDDYRLQVNHPIYVYKNGAVREWSGYANNADLLDGNEATAFATAAQGTTADSALQNISEDTTPQLGGDLDTNGFGIALGDASHVSTGNHLRLGDSGDIDIYHHSTDGSVIGNYTNNLYISNISNDSDVIINTKKSSNNGATVAFLADGSTGETILHYDGSQKLATKSTGVDVTGNITVSGTVDGRDVAVDGTKLDGIESGATADQTASEIKTAYESNADTNAFTDAEQSKLSGIEASADVTDTANVTAAGALMDSEVTNLAQVKTFDSSDYATAAQGATADSALQNVVEDTTPQLGGDLDVNSNNISLGVSGTAFDSPGSGNVIEFADSTDTFGRIYTTEFDSFGFTYNLMHITCEHPNAFDGIYISSTNYISCRINDSEKFHVDSTGISVSGNIDVSGTVDGKNVSACIEGVVEDTSPQLGGDLDANGNDIKLDANEKIYFGDATDPDVHHISYISSNDVLRFQANSNSGWEFKPQSGSHDFKLAAPGSAGGWDIDIQGNTTGGTITTNYDNYVNPVYFQKNGTTKISFLNSGDVRLANLNINDAYTLPTSDGTNGQVLTTDGSGAVTFQDVSGGGGGLGEGKALVFANLFG